MILTKFAIKATPCNQGEGALSPALLAVQNFLLDFNAELLLPCTTQRANPGRNF
jgi:hypothetical protein